MKSILVGAFLGLSGCVTMINDVATDASHPLEFVAIKPLRKNSEFKTDAEVQRQAYPELHGLELNAPPAAVFPKALALAKVRKWEIVDANSTLGRIEATETSSVFGFKDDMVIQVAEAPHGSRVDMRSASRVGKSDFGKNAKRIQSFLEDLNRP